ncbi:hypothetical protein Droror1_Dr00018214 [Drosera rotundifolia]
MDPGFMDSVLWMPLTILKVPFLGDLIHTQFIYPNYRLQGVVFQLDENPISPLLSRATLQAPSSSTSPLSRCSPSPATIVEICCELMLQPQAAKYKVEICCEFVARILVYLYRTCLLPILCICIEHVSVQGGDMFAPASSLNSLFFFCYQLQDYHDCLFNPSLILCIEHVHCDK